MSERARFFAEETWTGGVIGLGYVGLPLAVTMVARGLRVVAFDVSERRVAELDAGVSPIEDVTDDELAEALAKGLIVTSSEDDLIEVGRPLPLRAQPTGPQPRARPLLHPGRRSDGGERRSVRDADRARVHHVSGHDRRHPDPCGDRVRSGARRERLCGVLA